METSQQIVQNIENKSQRTADKPQILTIQPLLHLVPPLPYSHIVPHGFATAIPAFYQPVIPFPILLMRTSQDEQQAALAYNVYQL
jgi:hypothetical protein